MIGPNAAVARLGGYYGQPPHIVSILDGIKAKVGDRAKIVYAQGVKITENDDWWEDEVTLADPAENAKLIAAGGRGREGRGRDRPLRSATPSRPAAKPGPTTISATAPASIWSASSRICSMRIKRSASRSRWC